MRTRYFWHIGLAVITVLLGGVTQPGAAEKSRPQPARYDWIRENDKIVQSGDYALAWGALGKGIDPVRFRTDENYHRKMWDRVCPPDQWEPSAENYLVNRRTGRVVAKLPGCHDIPSLSHSHLNLQIAAKGNYVVVEWFGKWQPREVYIVPLRGKTGNATPLYSRYRCDLATHLHRVAGFRRSIAWGNGVDYTALEPEYVLGANTLMIHTGVSQSKALSGWSYTAGLTYSLDKGGRLSPTKPAVATYTEAKYLKPFAPEGSDMWDGYQTKEWIFRTALDGTPLARADVYNALRRDLLRRAHSRLPTGYFTRSAPDVDVSLTRFTGDTLTFDADIYPVRNADDSREWDAMHYAATATYRVRWRGNASTLRRTALREATKQDDTPTRRFGIPDPPR